MPGTGLGSLLTFCMRDAKGTRNPKSHVFRWDTKKGRGNCWETAFDNIVSYVGFDHMITSKIKLPFLGIGTRVFFAFLPFR